MATEDTFTIEITNQLGSDITLEINGERTINKNVAFTVSTPEPVTISRQGDTVNVTIPNSTKSEMLVIDGVCMCLSKQVTFTLTPSASMNITLQSGYFSTELPDKSRGVRCGDGF
ncbi:MAG TPA: hypothetical protein VGD58_32880 [Herpetosiphonaceae bacterium]